MYTVKQSTALLVPIFAHDEAGDAVTGMVNAGFTKRISKNGAAFGAMTVTIAELENGWYLVTISAAHSNTLGILSMTLTNAACKQINLQFRVEAELVDSLNANMVARTLDAAHVALLTASVGTIVNSTATGVPTTTTMPDSSQTEGTNDHFVGRVIIWTDGDAAGIPAAVTAYNGSTKVFTFEAVVTAASSGDGYILI